MTQNETGHAPQDGSSSAAPDTLDRTHPTAPHDPSAPAVHEDHASPLGLSLPEGRGRRVLVTGATGYVGGRLIPELLAAGFQVRAAARDPRDLQGRTWSDDVQAVQCDLSEPDQVRDAMDGVHTALYLVHSMGGKGDFVEREQRIADIVATAADEAGITQLVYLSGLHPDDTPVEELSDHMRSRALVAARLEAAATPVLTFEAGIVIGSGSTSFEMIRHLADRLVVMPGPSWLNNEVEPIAIRDVLYYLVHASALKEPVQARAQIGCGRAQPFKEMLTDYAEAAGLAKRRVFTLPIPAQRLSGLWIGLVTPIPMGVALPLAASLAEDAVTENHDVAQIIPDPPGGLTSYQDAVRRALKHEEEGPLEVTFNADIYASNDPAAPLPSDPEWAGKTVYTDDRERESSLPPEAVWPVIESIGGHNGYYSTPTLWKIRGLMDKLVGGPGLVRGRRDADHLRAGDHVDWWRVEEVEPGHRLTLRAEMKAGGRAWLQLSTEATDTGSRYRQRAIFMPDGALGRAYWTAILPFHALVFPEMAANILAEAERRHTGADRPSRRPGVAGLLDRLPLRRNPVRPTQEEAQETATKA